jgi:hypothetical protein
MNNRGALRVVTLVLIALFMMLATSACGLDLDHDGYSIRDGDCNDTNPDIHPGAPEVCNGIDDDCDRFIPADEIDDDEDGMAECEGDCDDTNATVYSGAAELCDGLDNDCDGQVMDDEHDDDDDGFFICGGDCDDADADIYPGAPELCDKKDNDCDGVIPKTEYDVDGDGMSECEGDCDETNTSVYAGAPELCDGLDNNCDGQLPENEHDDDADNYLICEGDCDDTDAEINPSAEEICDEVDNDCDVIVDEGFDTDQDGYKTCAGDCDDTDPHMNPGFGEICDEIDNDCDGFIDEGFDADGDGYDNWYSGCGLDCNDCDPLINPDADELCNGIDDNCDGQVDEGVQLTFYKDFDGDGYSGDYGVRMSTMACSAPVSYTAELGDCNESDPDINPGASEICDNKDNNCDGQVDEDLVTLSFYNDDDGDGFGGTDTIEACSLPLGYVEISGDCDDADPNIYPGSEEICDGLDNNCDGQVDEDVLSLFYIDRDGDGFGGAEVALACSAPIGYVDNSEDCDDAEANVYPNAAEVCDSVDNDCDGEVDEDLPILSLFRDADGDGYGSSENIQICSSVPGYVDNSEDCDDTDSYLNPGAAEACDDKDNNCNGEVDEGGVKVTFYEDQDGDGYGGTQSVEACSAPENFVANSADCNDADASCNPGAAEICDGLDNNCDGTVDEGMDDADGDGYSECTGDCNDGNAMIHPGATEIACDSIDQDCDGSDSCPVRFKDMGNGTILDTKTGIYWLKDANCIGPVYYEDTTIEDGSFVIGALARVGQLGHGQCGLSDGSGPGNWRIPTLSEIRGLFSIDHCEGQVFRDYDLPGQPQIGCLGNGAGNARWQQGDPFIDVVTFDINRPWDDPVGDYYWTSDSPDGWCMQITTALNPWEIHFYPEIKPPELYITQPSYLIRERARWYWQSGCGANLHSGWVWPVRDVLVDNDGDGYFSGPDCDDTNPAINPSAPEICNGVDDNCDGRSDELCDYDGDGYTPDAGDCNDGDQHINPAAAETCDDIDNNCNSQVDEGVKQTFFRDNDGDGYGASTYGTLQACSVSAGYVSNSGDCDDNDASINPDAEDPCDGVDNNCDGVQEDRNYYFRDRDGDGYGGLEITWACSLPDGHTTVMGDCDDTDPTINPEGTEVCDGKDNNCNGILDEGVTTTVYRDRDGDGYGGTLTLSVCTVRSGYVTTPGDCDDDDRNIYPGGTEYCDLKDNDCDGETDESEGLVCRFIDQDDGTILDTKTGLYWLKNAGCIGGGAMTYGQAEGFVADMHDGQCGLSDRSWAGAWRIPSKEEMMELCGLCGVFCYLGNAGECGPWSEGDAFNSVQNDGTDAYWTSSIHASGNQNLFRLFPMCTDVFNAPPDYPVYYTFYAWPVREALVDEDGDGYLILESTDEGPDCDDTDPAINPGAEEICNHVDDNCVSGVDEVCDWDSDGYTPNTGDCNDANDAVNPSQLEQTNGMDDNCDGKIDERFSVMGDGTVRDNLTGWRWLQDVMAIPPSTWEDAMNIVAGLQDGMYGLSDGSQLGDWQLPTRAELSTLVDPAYAYQESNECGCEVLDLPYYYYKCWEDTPDGPALSNGQGDGPWVEGDPFLHVDDMNGFCDGSGQNLCQNQWLGNGIIIPWGSCIGQAQVCNRNMIWTRETMEAYKSSDWSTLPPRPTRVCRTCTDVWFRRILGYWGEFPWEDPGGTCCIAYEINRGDVGEFWQGYYCYDELKVWPVRKD